MYIQLRQYLKAFKGEELTDFTELKNGGALVFTDDGIPLKSEMLVKEAMQKLKSWICR